MPSALLQQLYEPLFRSLVAERIIALERSSSVPHADSHDINLVANLYSAPCGGHFLFCPTLLR